MRFRCGMALVALFLARTILADDPVVPIEARGDVDVPSLVVVTVPSVPVDAEKKAVEAVQNVDLEVFDLLPSAERDQCNELVWSARLTERLPAFRAAAIRRCIFETQAVRDKMSDLFAKAEKYGAAPVDSSAIELQGRSVRFGSARLPVTDVTESIGDDAQDCIDPTGRPIVDCVQREAIEPMRTYLAFRADPAPLDSLENASMLLTAEVAQPGGGTVATVASLATSWESIIINAIADQMVVQLRGAAATRLLGVFGNSICKHDVNGTDVLSFFPETCNLLTHTQIDTSSSAAIAQIPGEFQRTLRNDTIASLPGLLSAAGGKDPMLAALGPVLVQFVAQSDEPFAHTASAAAQSYCDQNAAATPPDPRGVRACRTYDLIKAVGAAVVACDGQPASCAEPLIRDAYANWKTLFPQDSVKTAEQLYADVLALRTLYNASKKDADARIALLLQVLKTFGEYSKNDEGAFVLLRKWDQKSYRWATTALTVYQVAQDFRRGYEPLDLANAVFANTLCVQPASSTAYDVGCALKLTALTCQVMRDSLTATAGSELTTRLSAINTAFTDRINGLADTDPLKAWANDRNIVANVSALTSQVGPEFAALVDDVQRARALAEKTPRSAEEDQQLDALYNGIIDNLFTVWASVTGRTVPTDDAERAKRLITNTGVCWRAAREKNYGTLANALYSVALDSGIGKPFPPVVERYRLLLTNMVAAQDPDAFKSAVESYLSHTAAPDAKFESKTGLWLTGLPGVGIRGAGSDGDAGIFAPVGIDWMLNPGLFGGKGRLAVYGQLLDLGNLVKLKYDGDDATSGDVKFRDVWAPGLYLRYPWRSGFSLGAGGSYVPVTTDDEDKERTLKLRFNAFFAYDLSWFRLYGAGDPTLKDQTELRPGLGTRIRNWFRRK